MTVHVARLVRLYIVLKTQRFGLIAHYLPSEGGPRVSSDRVDYYRHIALTLCGKYWPRSGVGHVKRSLFAPASGLLGKAFPINANDEAQTWLYCHTKRLRFEYLLFLRRASSIVALTL
jgi:hypothetical protein